MYKILFLFISLSSFAQIKLGVLQYQGGGDWYANPTSVKNLIAFCNDNLQTNIEKEYEYVSVESTEIFQFPFIHMTGHGNVVFSEKEAKNLRKYLLSGGFLHIDDNYGMDPFIRPEMKKVFPELDWVELPASHPIFSQKYEFPNGLPKVHEHDNKPPQAFALVWEGRILCVYTYECDLGDGWEDQEVHNDSKEIRDKALKMGANILQFAFHQ
ncbi:MAG: DUF4159 domain-containing protein [Flavobacteriales bacterium]|jgi:hypothetical protein|nr:DUF4159 domain-containing protein [Flavobacteriales bacterium]